jgi:catechol 2,3-dioxygenase-like lactoylglutathione lyase family enzyme
MIETNLNHVGMVVPDVDAAMEAFSTRLGVTWVGVHIPLLKLRSPQQGVHELSLRIATSAQMPFLELIQAVPDSPWALSGDRILLHHIAYFVDELDADSAAIAGPCPIEIEGVGAGGDIPRIFTYHDLDGLRFELLERRRVPLG